MDDPRTLTQHQLRPVRDAFEAFLLVSRIRRSTTSCQNNTESAFSFEEQRLDFAACSFRRVTLLGRSPEKSRITCEFLKNKSASVVTSGVGRVALESPSRSGVRADDLPTCRFQSNNGQALLLAALHGVGIVMQPEALLADDVAAGRLVPVLSDFLPSPRPMHVIYPRDRQATPKLMTFIDFVVDRFGARNQLRRERRRSRLT